ncbi:MAG TPA: hypothetical protein PLB45_02630 [Bacilli bacterium]|nr:hypothetical protein [Bacilli bacterium]
MDSKYNKGIIIIFFVLIIINISVHIYNYNNDDYEYFNINYISYDKESNVAQLSVKRIGSYESRFTCVINGENGNLSISSINSECLINIKPDNHFKLSIISNNKEYDDYDLDNYLKDILYFKFNSDEIYLSIGGENTFGYEDVTTKDIDYGFYSSDENIFKIEDNKVIGVNAGDAYLVSDRVDSKIHIIVTDLISNYNISNKKKPLLSCNFYSDEENDELDKILSYQVNNAGYATRAGAIQAARFLTLEFNYRVPYFYENGRVHSSGINFVDGEGRYYKAGLYLSDSRKKNIVAKFAGPSIWGCPLTNYEEEPSYGFHDGSKMPNGLDCSGFIAWVLKNGGFDPGDIGAGESTYPYQMTDLAELVPITDDLIYSNKVRAGDLINYSGHIAMIIGIDDNNYYVAESLPYLGGVRGMIYPKDKVNETFDYIVLMDSFYKEDGNYTVMWN